MLSSQSPHYAVKLRCDYFWLLWFCRVILLHVVAVCLYWHCDQLLWCSGSCLYVTVLCSLWMWQGFPRALVMPTDISSPTVVLWQSTLLFGFFLQTSVFLEESKKYISLHVCVCVYGCARVWVLCLGLFIYAPSCACTNLWLICFNHFETIT